MFWRLSLKTNQFDAEQLGEALEPHVLAVSWYEVPKKENIWIVEATMDQEPNVAFLQTVIDTAAECAKIHSAKLIAEKLEDRDWLEATYRLFPPLTIGDFYIYGTHEKATVPESLIGIEINAATAFGSGEHETTKGCLAVLCDLHKTYDFQRILDMGCGSGILSIAASKLWKVPVISVDNDPESVKVTTENASLNGSGGLVKALCNEGFSGSLVNDCGPYSLIIANILAKPLCDMAHDMVNHLLPQGIIVLSGLLKTQISDVLRAYNEAGAQLLREKSLGDWATLVLQK